MITSRYLPNQEAIRRMTTDELRSAFLLDGLFLPGDITMVYADTDRAIVGGVIPTAGPLPLLPSKKEMAAEYFLERREVGIVNLGSRGTVTAGGELHTLEKNDMLYVGRGTRDVLFSSADPSAPAVFFFVSFPAHTAHPAAVARHRDAERSAIGSAEGASRRTIRRFIHPGGVKSCQLVMGLTELEPGCVWNTMPPHTHSRRMEVYLYYDLGPEDMVVHLMGTPVETRSLIVHGLQGVISPGWSIHCGAATRPYSFIWAMGGENQEFADMDPVAAAALR